MDEGGGTHAPAARAQCGVKDEANRRRVLIIDDAAEIPDLVKLILSRARPNDEVTIIASAREGIMAAEQDQPDLIIVRLFMREMDGYEVCRQLKSRSVLQNIPVLLQGALISERVCPIAKQVGAAGYVYEPFSPREYLAAYETVLSGGEHYPPLPEPSQSV